MFAIRIRFVEKICVAFGKRFCYFCPSDFVAKQKPELRARVHSGTMKYSPLRLFISCAHEDMPIAAAVSECLTAALGNLFAEVSFGGPRITRVFDTQAQEQLNRTDILIVVHNGYGNPSHSFTGAEVGYFLALLDAQQKTSSGLNRQIVPMFFGDQPASFFEDQPASFPLQGLSLNINRSMLEMSTADFEDRLQIDSGNGFVVFLAHLRQLVEEIRVGNAGGAPLSTEFQQPTILVRKMLLAIFRHLKTTVQSVSTLHKQLKITFARKRLKHLKEFDLPPDARLIPVGPRNPLEIFGLHAHELSWTQFLSLIANDSHRDSWREAIVGVVTQSLSSQVDSGIDQIIVSTDESRSYRVVLAKSTTYFDSTHES